MNTDGSSATDRFVQKEIVLDGADGSSWAGQEEQILNCEMTEKLI